MLVFVVQVAKVIEVAPIRVYEVATFYSMFNRAKVRKLTFFSRLFHCEFCHFDTNFSNFVLSCKFQRTSVSFFYWFCRLAHTTFWFAAPHLVWFVVHEKLKMHYSNTWEWSAMVRFQICVLCSTHFDLIGTFKKKIHGRWCSWSTNKILIHITCDVQK